MFEAHKSDLRLQSSPSSPSAQEPCALDVPSQPNPAEHSQLSTVLGYLDSSKDIVPETRVSINIEEWKMEGEYLRLLPVEDSLLQVLELQGTPFSAAVRMWTDCTARSTLDLSQGQD